MKQKIWKLAVKQVTGTSKVIASVKVLQQQVACAGNGDSHASLRHFEPGGGMKGGTTARVLAKK